MEMGEVRGKAKKNIEIWEKLGLTRNINKEENRKRHINKSELGLDFFNLTRPLKVVSMITLKALCLKIQIHRKLKLCLATATHNFKWVKIT